jgi:hypothetical protein
MISLLFFFAESRHYPWILLCCFSWICCNGLSSYLVAGVTSTATYNSFYTYSVISISDDRKVGFKNMKHSQSDVCRRWDYWL